MTMLHDQVRALFAAGQTSPRRHALPDGGPRSVPARTGVEGEYLALFTSPTSCQAAVVDHEIVLTGGPKLAC
jgi:hypothetical protein